MREKWVLPLVEMESPPEVGLKTWLMAAWTLVPLGVVELAKVRVAWAGGAVTAPNPVTKGTAAITADPNLACALTTVSRPFSRQLITTQRLG